MATAPAHQDTGLLTLFVASGRNVHRTAVLLCEMLAAYPDRSSELAAAVLDCEHQGDRIAHDILHRMAEQGTNDSGLEAADVHRLTCALDDVVDHAEETADRLGLYGIEAPMEQAQAIAAILVVAAERVADSLVRLHAGADLRAGLIEIHRLENEADRLGRAAVASLFATGIDPMTVIRWKDVYATLEDAVDACETVANVLEGITLKLAHRRAAG